MIGLVDCNNFFVSCERLRHPELHGRPVIVLSNNDGCAVALSNEAKALGLRRGVPYFKVKEMAEARGVVALSGDLRFYREVSAKVMQSLSELSGRLQIYSVDEAFFEAPEELGNLEEYGRYVVEKVLGDVGVAVSVGIAATKTLAKVAASFAKRYPGFHSVCLLSDPQKVQKALQLTAVGDVWGVGRQNAVRLLAAGVTTAHELALLSREKLGKIFGNITIERTWRELRGEPCIEQTREAANKSMMLSRTFPHDVEAFQDMRNIVRSFADKICRQLRAQHLRAAEIELFIATNRHHPEHPQYSNMARSKLSEPTDYTPTIAAEADRLLTGIFRNGYRYKRAGILVPKVVSSRVTQPGLFDDVAQQEKRRRLMQITDAQLPPPDAFDDL